MWNSIGMTNITLKHTYKKFYAFCIGAEYLCWMFHMNEFIIIWTRNLYVLPLNKDYNWQLFEPMNYFSNWSYILPNLAKLCSLRIQSHSGKLLLLPLSLFLFLLLICFLRSFLEIKFGQLWPVVSVQPVVSSSIKKLALWIFKHILIADLELIVIKLVWWFIILLFFLINDGTWSEWIEWPEWPENCGGKDWKKSLTVIIHQ